MRWCAAIDVSLLVGGGVGKEEEGAGRSVTLA
jgi:hypothetical protein